MLFQDRLLAHATRLLTYPLAGSGRGVEVSLLLTLEAAASTHLQAGQALSDPGRCGRFAEAVRGARSGRFRLSGMATRRLLHRQPEQVPVGNAAGHVFSSWLNPTSILIGTVAVATSAYLAAVYLAADAARLGEPDLERDFRRRALGSGVVVGAIAIGGLAVLHGDAHHLFHELVAGDALPALVVSIVAGMGTLGLIFGRRFEAARYTAALAVAAVVAGWALGQWPSILPGLTVRQAAASHDTLVAVVVAVLAGGAILFPSLALLFRLALQGRFEGPEVAAEEVAPGERHAAKSRLTARVAAACLIVGFGLLNVAEGSWAHALGLLSLFGFMVSAFLAIVPVALAAEEGATRPESGKPSRLR